jgi:4-amino-4-deoxy-L-arabinose transferase-like glycosyltransferase
MHTTDPGRRRWAIRAAVAFLLAVFAAQAWIAALRDSVTIDEFVHLPIGLYDLQTGDLSFDPINPPHTRMLAALPALLEAPAFAPPPAATDSRAPGAEWRLGYHLMRANADRYQEIFLAARAGIIALTVLLGALVALWASQLYGRACGLIATFFFAFTPDLLAHGHLVTLDASGALGFAATAFATWRLIERPGLSAALLTGAALGIASLLKLSGVVLVAAIFAVVAVRAMRERDRSLWQWGGLLAAALLTAAFVINAGYGFVGTFAPLSGAQLDPTGAFARLREAAPWLRLPVPFSFLEGVDMVMNAGKLPDTSYYLAGRLSQSGWWYYHLVAFALKSSLPMLLFTIGCLAQALLRGGMGRREYALWIPIALIFLSNALFNSFQLGVRHVLPVYPLLLVLISPRVRHLLAGFRSGGRSAALAVAAALLLVWHAAGTLAVAPRYLQFFNELAGGAEGGHRWLIDSNVDWGQDLIRLREYLERERIAVVNLAYFGRVNPKIYGIQFVPLERDSRGIGVISASFLMGRPYLWYQGGRMRWVPVDTYAWLRDREPIARVGSMFVYRLD